MTGKKAGSWLKKVLQKENALRFAVICGICGMALLALSSLDFGSDPPEETSQEPPDSTAYARSLEEEMARIVTAITGEREPAVMITLENDGRQVYAADEKVSGSPGSENGGERESAHVILEDREGAQRPLTVTAYQPKIQGVVIVSARAGDPATREKLVNAARTALGISSSRVCVTCGEVS